MRLYLIKRRSDGKFFGNVNGYYEANTGRRLEYWSDKPQQFLKTPEGVAANLRRLCSKPFFDRTPPQGLHPSLKKSWSELGWRNFDASKLVLYEVVVMDVNVISMTATPAENFVQIEAIEQCPLNKREREAAE